MISMATNLSYRKTKKAHILNIYEKVENSITNRGLMGHFIRLKSNHG